MPNRVNYAGFIIAGLGFFLTRFTVTLALYEDPVRFFLAGFTPLALGLGLAAFGVALAVSDAAPSTVRTVALWAVIGAGTMLLLALLTLFGSGGGQLPAIETVRSRAYLSNFLIGGSIGGTLTGLYASRNRRQRTELERQANRLEVLNRLIRHEVLNAATIIRGYADEAVDWDTDARAIIRRQADEIEATVNDVKHLARSARPELAVGSSIALTDQLRASQTAIQDGYPEVVVSVPDDSELVVRADQQLSALFEQLFEWAIVRGTDTAQEIEVEVESIDESARIDIRAPGVSLTDRTQALLETGEITQYDDPSTGFEANIARLLVERYDGSIEVTAENGGTVISTYLPLAPEATPEQFTMPGEVSGIRPALPHMAVTFVAAMIAGVFWGVGSEFFGGSVAFIGVFYGTASPVVGWFTHQFHSAVFGFIYAGWLSLLPARYRHHVGMYVAVGIAWGLALWIAAAGVIAPIWLRLLGIEASIPNLSFSLFVAHVVWGITLGLLTVFGYRYVVPRMANPNFITAAANSNSAQ